MRSAFSTRATITALLVAVTYPAVSSAESRLPFERTENIVTCEDYTPLKRPFFGETHLHTSFSFDAYNLNVRNTPKKAYAFAKGAEVTLPAANAREGVPQSRTAQLRRPIDFAAITDHSELLGPMQICTRSPESTTGYDSFQCRQERTGLLDPDDPTTYNPEAVAGSWATQSLLLPDSAKPLLPLCNNADCDAAEVSIWQDIQKAAKDAYAPCHFTSFIGYEFTAQPLLSNLHRNVIFRNEQVPETPVDNVTIDGPDPISKLWDGLQSACLDNPDLDGCDVLTIPHNANLSENVLTGEGEMYLDPSNIKEARQRAFFEPLAEIYQHKGSSECRYDRLAGAGVETDDPLCTFEQLLGTILGPQPNPPDIDEYPPRNLLRNVLKDGMALARFFGGVNPFKFGFAAATDSHNGDPGNTVEQDFQGHAGSLDAPLANMIGQVRLGPGGLLAVWAEENTRDAIFSGMRRKETYATSGTRPIVRFFGGRGLNARRMGDLCRRFDRIKIGYRLGVPMGGDLPPLYQGRPSFLVAAMRDAESAPLQRVQIVKGWVDEQGETHERVFNVAGIRGPASRRSDRDICESSSFEPPDFPFGRPGTLDPRLLEYLRTLTPPPGGVPLPPGLGSNELCTVWTDRSFDPNVPAFYYARVLEMPTCRWSTLACQSGGVDPFASTNRCEAQAARANAAAIASGEIQPGETPFNNCCLTERNDPFAERTIQERAWTSPIWYTPGG